MATLLELTAKIARVQTPKAQAFKNKNTDFVDLTSGDIVGGDLVNAGILSEQYEAFRDVGHVKFPNDDTGEFVHVVIGRRRAFLPGAEAWLHGVGPQGNLKTKRYTIVYDVMEFDDENVYAFPLVDGLSLSDATKIADYFYHLGNHHAMRHNDPKIQAILKSSRAK